MVIRVRLNPIGHAEGWGDTQGEPERRLTHRCMAVCRRAESTAKIVVGTPGAEEERKDSPTFQREHSSAHTLIPDLGSQNFEEINASWPKPPVCGVLLQWPLDMNTYSAS